tara:strand:+ start:483 stop:1355 length:873 start_codon:yes stop_codon:yes gene_type:complete
MTKALSVWEGHPFFKSIHESTYGRKKGGGIVLVTAQGSGLGLAKTSHSAALYYALNEHFGHTPNEEAEVHISSKGYIEAWENSPGQEQPNALILDEANLSAAEAQRWQRNTALQLGHQIQAARVARRWGIFVVPSWSMVTKRIRTLSNYVVENNETPFGSARAYKIILDFKTGDVRRQRLGQPFAFPDMSESPAYIRLAKLKQEYLDNSFKMIDEEDTKQERIKLKNTTQYIQWRTIALHHLRSGLSQRGTVRRMKEQQEEYRDMEMEMVDPPVLSTLQRWIKVCEWKTP